MNLFKKIVNKLTNQPEEEEKPSLEKLGDSLKNADLDYKFAQLFTHSGGFFNYCADEAEALQTLNQIIRIEGISNFFLLGQGSPEFFKCCENTIHSGTAE